MSAATAEHAPPVAVPADATDLDAEEARWREAQRRERRRRRVGEEEQRFHGGVASEVTEVPLGLP
jgi:hypothetical protein